MAKKVNPKEKFKKIIFSFWFWVIVAVVSYFIFVLISIQWTGEGLEIEEGTGSLRTFFAYFTQIAWIIVIVILIVDIIKWIQKTKIGDYWKISFTILGIIGIIAYVIYSFAGLGIFDKFTYDSDSRILDSENEKIIKIHIELLEEEGYEVLYFGYLDYNDTSLDTAYLKMKSLGNRQEQVLSGLSSLSLVYPEVPEYTIRILEPTQECWYEIPSKLDKAFYEGEEFILNGEIIDSQTAYNLIVYIIENPSCS